MTSIRVRVEPVELGAELVETPRDRVGDGDGIGAALLVDRQLDRLGAVDAGDDLALLVAGVDPGHVGKPDDGVAGAVDDDRSHVLGAHELVDGAHQVLGVAVAQACRR